MRRILFGIVLVSGCTVGCRSSTTEDKPSTGHQKGDIKIHVPGVNVDIDRDKSKKHVDVDVNPK
jgi:hypothetical protein